MWGGRSSSRLKPGNIEVIGSPAGGLSSSFHSFFILEGWKSKSRIQIPIVQASMHLDYYMGRSSFCEFFLAFKHSSTSKPISFPFRYDQHGHSHGDSQSQHRWFSTWTVGTGSGYQLTLFIGPSSPVTTVDPLISSLFQGD